MKPIFNSLGSNYSFGFAWLALRQIFNFGEKKRLDILKKELERMFGGSALLLYKGRDAIEVALRAYDIGVGDTVLTQAFACCAVEGAIARTGAQPAFVDIEQRGSNLSVSTLKIAMERAQSPKAVIVQNILGVSADIEQIKKWCDEHKLILIEDLAQSIGAVSSTGKPLGSFGDAVVLSFGRDKVIDAVSGGAVVFRSKPKQIPIPDGRVGWLVVVRDMFYPILTWKIRKTHRIMLGKVILRLSKIVGLDISSADSPIKASALMPSAYARLVLAQLKGLNKQMEHRRKMADVYFHELKDKSTFLVNDDLLGRGANLRFALLVESPDEFAAFMKKRDIHISDRWYRSPVDCGNIEFKSSYRQGFCPNAEELSKKVINLPTHININRGDAVRIARAVNDYLK